MIEMELSSMSELPRFISMARRLGPPAASNATPSSIDAAGTSSLQSSDRSASDRAVSRWRRLLSAPTRNLELA